MEMIFDTTDSEGYVLVELPPGNWWVHTRYEEAYSELYWNEPITVERGDPLLLTLNRSNAETRPIF
jgi:hypothetical protein